MPRFVRIRQTRTRRKNALATQAKAAWFAHRSAAMTIKMGTGCWTASQRHVVLPQHSQFFAHTVTDVKSLVPSSLWRDLRYQFPIRMRRAAANH